MSEELKPREKVVIYSASYLPRAFSLESLAVSSWITNPKMFGLGGYESHYPDVRKVSEIVFKKRGLVSRGYFLKKNNSSLEITDTCRDRIKLMQMQSLFDGDVVWMFDTTAFKKFDTDKNSIDFGDALEFWGSVDQINILNERLKSEDSEEYRMLLHAHSWMVERFKKQIHAWVSRK